MSVRYMSGALKPFDCFMFFIGHYRFRISVVLYDLRTQNLCMVLSMSGFLVILLAENEDLLFPPIITYLKVACKVTGSLGFRTSV